MTPPTSARKPAAFACLRPGLGSIEGSSGWSARMKARRSRKGLIKNLTGGDTVTARHRYNAEFDFTPRFKLWLLANHWRASAPTTERCGDGLCKFRSRTPSLRLSATRRSKSGSAQTRRLSQPCWRGWSGGVVHVQAGWDDVEGEIEIKSAPGERACRSSPSPTPSSTAPHGHRQTREAKALVFVRTDADPFLRSTPRSRARKAWKTAGLDPVTMHECRHSYARTMIAPGVDPRRDAPEWGTAQSR